MGSIPDSVEAYRAEVTDDLAGYGITDATAFTDWLRFSSVQAATCLNVSASSVVRFRQWRQTRKDEDAWS